MLNLNALQKQFAGFGRYQIQEQNRRSLILENALEVFRQYDQQRFESVSLEDVPKNTNAKSRPNQLMAVPLELPTSVYDPVVRPVPLTVVATDGSQIYPDRNVEPLCYLLNVGRIAFQYGTTERPLMDAVPHLYFKGQELSSVSGLEIDVVGQEIVSALRDELELGTLADLAIESQQNGRPVLAMADGTLIRWMIKRLRKPELEQKLLQRYFTALDKFRDNEIPLCSYISMPGNAEFINYLAKQMVTGEEPAEKLQFEGISDRMFFKQVLKPGQRSATFKSESLVLKEYPPAQEICYFYIHIEDAGRGSEIARVEFPLWMTASPDILNLVQSTVLSECQKGKGYPMILSEAHEHAIIRSQERFMFYEMIEREMLIEGATIEISSKKTSKDSPVL